MTQDRKINKKIGLVSAGLATVALAGSVWLASGSGVVGQTPKPQDVAPVPTPTPAGVQIAPVVPTGPTATGDVAALRARFAQLQTTLQKTPTSAEEQLAQQQAIVEMTRLQSQIQQLEAASGNFSAYRQARDAQLAQSGQTGAAPIPGGASSVDPTLAGANGVGGGLPDATRQDILNASGLNGGIPGQIGGGFATSPEERAMLIEQRDGLMRQYRQLQQTLRALQPGDEALAENLKEEQKTLLSQLKEIDSRLVVVAPGSPAPTTAAPIAPTIPNPAATTFPNPAAPDSGLVNPWQPPANSTLPIPGQAPNDVLERMEKAQQAAQLLREAGLLQLAGHVVNEIPRMSNPGFTETTLVAGSWAESAGMSEEANNPFHMVSPKDIEGINSSINALKARIDALDKTLSDVDTQLKLLTRQQVSGYVTQPQAPNVQTPDAEPTAPEAPANDETPVEESAPLSTRSVPDDDLLMSFAQTRDASASDRTVSVGDLEFLPIDSNDAN